jgi:hypothetical protein
LKAFEDILDENASHGLFPGEIDENDVRTLTHPVEEDLTAAECKDVRAVVDALSARCSRDR